MRTVLRAYVGTVCHRDPESIVKVLSKPTEPIDLDVADEKEHVRMMTSDELAGQTVRIGEYEIQIEKREGSELPSAEQEE